MVSYLISRYCEIFFYVEESYEEIFSIGNVAQESEEGGGCSGRNSEFSE